MAMDWIKSALRRAAALAVLCALILAPVIIAATHGPGLPGDGTLTTEHLLHGHSHDEPEPGQSGLAHDATDHEHQTHGVPPGKWSTFWDNFIPRYGGSIYDSQTGKGRLRRAVSDLTLNKLMRPGDRVVEYTGVLGSLSFIMD